MVILLERAAHSVNRLFYLYYATVFVSHFGLEGMILVMIAPVHAHCLHFTLYITNLLKINTNIISTVIAYFYVIEGKPF